MINDPGQRGVGGNVVYFTFLVIYYGFANIAGVKSSWGWVGGRGKCTIKKFILPHMPMFKSYYH